MDKVDSPTGPLFGYRTKLAEAEAGVLERKVQEEAGLTLEDFRRVSAYKTRGGRRPLRFQPVNCLIKTGRDELGEYLELGFELEAGCYATALMREICKNDNS